MRHEALVLFLLCLTTVASREAAAGTRRELPAPVLQVGLDLVRIDATVTDSKGRPITDLRPEDFTLRIDGQPQRIGNAAFFGRAAAAAGGSAPESSAPVPVPAAHERSLVFLVDDLNMSFSSMHRATRAMTAFAKEWNAADATVGVRLTSEDDSTLALSRDPAKFEAALARVRYNFRSDKGMSNAATYDNRTGDPESGMAPIDPAHKRSSRPTSSGASTA